MNWPLHEHIVTLGALYEEVLKSNADVMRQWEGKDSTDSYDEANTG